MNAMNDNLHAIWSESVRRSAPANRREAASKAAPATKQIITIRLDQDVLAWLKAQGPGYQTRINQMLRDQMATSAETQTD